MNKKSTPSSLERIYPADTSTNDTIAGTNSIDLHVERYHYAGKNLAPGIIADIACGAGYGSFLLATNYKQSVDKIFAVDNNDEAIAYAIQHYEHHSISYLLADAFSFKSPLPINTIISLETIEHLDEPGEFIKYYSEQLVNGGRFIVSAPVTPSMDANPFHKQDFTIKSFKQLFIKNGFRELSFFIQLQSYQPFKLFGKRRGREKSLRKNMLGYYFRHPEKLLLRLKSFIKDGFVNKYIVIVFEKI